MNQSNQSAGCAACGIGYGLAPRDTPLDEIGVPTAPNDPESRVRCYGDRCIVTRVDAGGRRVAPAPPGRAREAGQVFPSDVTIDRTTWNAMSVDQRIAWIRANRADVASEHTATAARQATAELRTAAERTLLIQTATRGFDALFGEHGIFRQSHEQRMEQLRQDAETARARIRAEADVEIARWNEIGRAHV